jgi:hypothetical protein
MISHYTVLLSLIVGVPQGVLIAIRFAQIFGITGGFIQLLFITAGCLVGTFIGYAEILVVKNIISKTK